MKEMTNEGGKEARGGAEGAEREAGNESRALREKWGEIAGGLAGQGVSRPGLLVMERVYLAGAMRALEVLGQAWERADGTVDEYAGVAGAVTREAWGRFAETERELEAGQREEDRRIILPGE